MKYLAFIAFVLLCGFLGVTDSQVNSTTIDEVQDKITGLVPELNNFNKSALPTIETASKLFKQKCDKNGGPDAYNNAINAKEQMEQCLQSLVNVTELQIEVERYKPSGDLDIVFKKYCKKSPVLKRCVQNFTTAVEPCLEQTERENKRIVQNITESLLGFVCYKEGDRIALFISTGGPECFESKQEEVTRCVNETFSGYVSAVDPKTGGFATMESIPSLVFGNKECTDITKLQTCVVKELEKCQDPTPANIVDAIFSFILRVTPCKDVLQSQGVAMNNQQNSAASLSSYLSTISAALLLVRLM